MLDYNLAQKQYQPVTSFQAKSLDIQYDVGFRTPFFGLARSNVEVLQALYEQFPPRYGIQSSDLQAVGGSVMSQLRATLTLFRGNGIIEVSSDKLHVKFSNATGKDDVAIIQDCIIHALTALSRFISESQFGPELIVVKAFLGIAGGTTERDKFLDRFHMPYVDGLAKSTNLIISPAIKFDIQNEAEKWNVNVELSRAWIDPEAIFLAVNGNFSTGASAQTLPRRADIIQGVMKQALEAVGLQSELSNI